jgi:hypothetical protein
MLYPIACMWAATFQPRDPIPAPTLPHVHACAPRRTGSDPVQIPGPTLGLPVVPDVYTSVARSDGRSSTGVTPPRPRAIISANDSTGQSRPKRHLSLTSPHSTAAKRSACARPRRQPRPRPSPPGRGSLLRLLRSQAQASSKARLIVHRATTAQLLLLAQAARATLHAQS